MGETTRSLPNEAGIWLEELRKALQVSRLSKETAEVVGYYEEFLLDAVEAGHETETLVLRFGSPGQVVSSLLSERSIFDAEAKPSPVRLVSATRKALKATATAAGRVAIVTAAAVPLLSGLCLYLCGFLLFLVPPALATALLLEMPLVPAEASDTRTGLVGLALLVAGICLGAGWLLWSGANRLTRLTMRMIRRNLPPKGDASATSSPTNLPVSRTRSARVLRRVGASALGVSVLVGLILLLGSSLAYNYFSVWNSMRPSQIEVTERSVSVEGVEVIQIDGLNSRLLLETIAGDRIVVKMESPDWVDPEIVIEDGLVRIRETSNETLPFFSFFSIHEGTTDIRIGIPEGMTLKSLRIRTNGGDVLLGATAEELDVRTATGDIHVSAECFDEVPSGVGSQSGEVAIVMEEGK